MHKGRKNSHLSKKWSRLKREGRDTLVSGLGFVPGLGTAGDSKASRSFKWLCFSFDIAYLLQSSTNSIVFFRMVYN